METNLSPEEIGLQEALKIFFNFKSCCIVKKIKRLDSSVLWKLKTQDDRLLLLKEKSRYLRDDDFTFHLRLQNYIYEQHGPVVRVITTADNGLWFGWGGRKFELQEWFEGEPFSYELPDDMRELGRLIAEFQVAGKDFEDEKKGDWAFPQNRSEMFPETCQEISAYAMHLDQKLIALGRGKTSVSSWLKGWIGQQKFSNEQRSLPQQFIHADAYGSNCLRGRSGKSVLIDLDGSHWGYRLTDVAMAVAVYAGMTWNPKHSPPYHIRDQWNLDNSECILKGFESRSPLTDEERESFKEIVGLNLIRAFISCLYLDDPVPPPDDLMSQADTLISFLESL